MGDFFSYLKTPPKKVFTIHHNRGLPSSKRQKGERKNKKRVAVTTLCPFSEEVKEGIYKTLNNPGDGLTIMSENQTVQKCACSESFCGYKFQVVYLLLRCSSEQVSSKKRPHLFVKVILVTGYGFLLLSLFGKQQQSKRLSLLVI